MNFVCDNCSSRYFVDDAKVQGRAVRIRCKRCEHIISIQPMEQPGAAPGAQRQPEAAEAAAEHPAAAKRAASLEDIAWHYSVNGKSFGPFDEDDLIAKFLSGQLGDETYVWNTGMEGWKPAYDVPVFAPALSEARRRLPPPATVAEPASVEPVESPGPVAPASLSAAPLGQVPATSGPKGRAPVLRPDPSEPIWKEPPLAAMETVRAKLSGDPAPPRLNFRRPTADQPAAASPRPVTKPAATAGAPSDAAERLRSLRARLLSVSKAVPAVAVPDPAAVSPLGLAGVDERLPPQAHTAETRVARHPTPPQGGRPVQPAADVGVPLDVKRSAPLSRDAFELAASASPAQSALDTDVVTEIEPPDRGVLESLTDLPAEPAPSGDQALKPAIGLGPDTAVDTPAASDDEIAATEDDDVAATEPQLKELPTIAAAAGLDEPEDVDESEAETLSDEAPSDEAPSNEAPSDVVMEAASDEAVAPADEDVERDAELEVETADDDDADDDSVSEPELEFDESAFFEAGLAADASVADDFDDLADIEDAAEAESEAAARSRLSETAQHDLARVRQAGRGRLWALLSIFVLLGVGVAVVVPQLDSTNRDVELQRFGRQSDEASAGTSDGSGQLAPVEDLASLNRSAAYSLAASEVRRAAIRGLDRSDERGDELLDEQRDEDRSLAAVARELLEEERAERPRSRTEDTDPPAQNGSGAPTAGNSIFRQLDGRTVEVDRTPGAIEAESNRPQGHSTAIGSDYFNEDLPRVRRAVQRCHELQLRENARVTLARVVLDITVRPDGSVSIDMADDLARTTFGRCLQTRYSAWTFREFEGDAVTLQRTYALQ